MMWYFPKGFPLPLKHSLVYMRLSPSTLLDLKIMSPYDEIPLKTNKEKAITLFNITVQKNK